MCNLMRLRMNDERERRLEDPQEALDENTKSRAIDEAARFTGTLGNHTDIPTTVVAWTRRRGPRRK